MRVNENRQVSHSWTLGCSLVFKALNNPDWPCYATLQRDEPNRNLRSSSTVQFTIPLIKGRFKDSASKAFNQLPVNIRNSETFTSFARH